MAQPQVSGYIRRRCSSEEGSSEGLSGLTQRVEAREVGARTGPEERGPTGRACGGERRVAKWTSGQLDAARIRVQQGRRQARVVVRRTVAAERKGRPTRSTCVFQTGF